jgi:hypothetical protein
MIQINYRLEALYEIKLQLNGKLSVGNLGTSVLSSKGNTPDDRSPLTIHIDTLQKDMGFRQGLKVESFYSHSSQTPLTSLSVLSVVLRNSN